MIKGKNTHYSTIEQSKAGAPNGLPRPMVKPLVPSGILGPFEECLGDASHWGVLADCGDGVSSPRLPWIWPRPLPLPRSFAHPFFDAPEFSSA